MRARLRSSYGACFSSSLFLRVALRGQKLGTRDEQAQANQANHSRTSDYYRRRIGRQTVLPPLGSDAMFKYAPHSLMFPGEGT